jgi:hypothetical protein
MIFVVAQGGGAIFPSLTGVIAARASVQVLPPNVVRLIVAMASLGHSFQSLPVIGNRGMLESFLL